jgi:hypothetical protein
MAEKEVTRDHDAMSPQDDDTACLQGKSDAPAKSAALEQPSTDVNEVLASEPGHRQEEISASVPPSLSEKRGRLVMVGLTTAVILSLIAVLVAGVFRLTSTWLLVSKEQQSADGPTPILWNRMVSDKVQAQPLSVPKGVTVPVGLKETVVPHAESASEQDK